jgi:hypothetical protein
MLMAGCSLAQDDGTTGVWYCVHINRVFQSTVFWDMILFSKLHVVGWVNSSLLKMDVVSSFLNVPKLLPNFMTYASTHHNYGSQNTESHKVLTSINGKKWNKEIASQNYSGLYFGTYCTRRPYD